MKERFFIPAPTPTDRTETVNDIAFPVYLDGDKPMKWSGSFPVPPIESRIWIRMNRIGWAIVKGYFESCGYVGVMALPEDPPKWLLDQRRREKKEPGYADRPQWYKDGIGCFFGNEMALEQPA